MTINPDLARIKTDLSGNETDYSASIKAVKSVKDDINTSITSLTTSTNDTFKRMAAIYPGFAQVPLHKAIKDIDQSVFGIYTTLNDADAPVNSHSNDWFTIVNIPGQQGNSYSIQIAFSYWNLNDASYGVWIKHGRDTTWLRLTFTS